MISVFTSTGIDFFPPSPANFTLDSDMHRQCINVALASDRFVDGQKFFTSEITTPSLSSQQVVIGAPANVIITDNDSKEIMSIIIVFLIKSKTSGPLLI